MAGAAASDGPMQLIRIDDGGKCHLQEPALEVLRGIRGRLGVVGVAGLYRTGKSFLLNRLLGSQKGFDIGPTVNPCTKGLWIWGKPLQLAPDYYCILLDTEGLGSTQRSARCDLQIFSLCILLSSFFIYNSMGAIDEQAIDDLHVCCISRSIFMLGAGASMRTRKKRVLLNIYHPFCGCCGTSTSGFKVKVVRPSLRRNTSKTP
jgi:hypothetical protein